MFPDVRQLPINIPRMGDFLKKKINIYNTVLTIVYFVLFIYREYIAMVVLWLIKEIILDGC